MFKKFLKIISFLILLLIIVLAGLYFIPPGQEEIKYNYITDEPAINLDSKVGCYKTTDGLYYQVTWGAKSGLQLNYFDSVRTNLKSLRLNIIDENNFDTDGDLSTTEAKFIVEEKDSLTTLQVNTSQTNLSAVQKDSLNYNQKEVQYYNSETELTALLLTPFINTKSTAIIFIHGSGVSDRNNFWYMYQADFLARQGFTVILPDKRGCGKSFGEWHTASFNDFANDTKAAIDYLTKNHSPEFSKIGVLGLSQGGWISHIINQNSNIIDFVVDVVGSSTTPSEQIEFEIMNEIKDRGVPEFLANPLATIFAKRAKDKKKIWWNKNGNFDPIPLMSKTKIPILKIFGGNDQNVPVKRSLKRLNELISNQTDLPITIKIFGDSGHALFNSNTNWIRNDYLDYVTYWIGKQ